MLVISDLKISTLVAICRSFAIDFSGSRAVGRNRFIAPFRSGRNLW